jgi:outer membrane protein assembly factor BamB
VPQDTASPVSAYPSSEASDFPADTRTIHVSAAEFVGDGILETRIRLLNPHPDVLHVRLAPGAGYLAVTPIEAALGPEETQTVIVRTDLRAARLSVREGAAPGSSVQLLYQRLGTHESTGPAAPPRQASIRVQFPCATCPACKRSLDAAIAGGEIGPRPEVCPYCYERLRPCPVCGAPNAWTARVCVLDATHVIRSGEDWGMLGGGPRHDGARAAHAGASLARRWSFPSVAPARRENALTWSAPVAAYGMVAAAAATAEGEAHLYAFDARNGAPLYDPYPLPDPVYPDRGGIAIAGGRLLAATVEGTCIGLDALRGTRLWEIATGDRVFGAIVPTSENGPALVAAARLDGTGRLLQLDPETGALLRATPLDGAPDAAPAFADGIAYVHADTGTLTAIDILSGAILWTAACGAGFDAAPILCDGSVYSATVGGNVSRFDARTGEQIWALSVTNSPFGGTPACDGALLYLPADDGVHLVAAASGRAVRRHPVRQPVRAAPILAGGTLFFGATDGSLYGAPAGRPLERLYETATNGAQIVAAPALADGTLFVAATNGVLYALATSEGADTLDR